MVLKTRTRVLHRRVKIGKRILDIEDVQLLGNMADYKILVRREDESLIGVYRLAHAD